MHFLEMGNIVVENSQIKGREKQGLASPRLQKTIPDGNNFKCICQYQTWLFPDYKVQAKPCFLKAQKETCQNTLGCTIVNYAIQNEI